MNAQASNGQNILLQGRLVWTLGNKMSEGKKKVDDYSKQPAIDPKTGQQIVEYGFGLAIPKIDPRTGQNTAEYIKIYQLLQQEALSLYPSGQIPQDFAFKFKDGDTSVDEKGVSYSKREGYAGHFVLACTSRIPFKMFVFENGNNILVNDGIKCGDYVNVQLNIKAHPPIGRGKPGLYVNPSAIQLIQPGKEIINTPSGDQLFGTQMPSYVGQVEAPVAPQMPMGAPVMPPQQGYAQQPPMSAPQVQPHYGVLPPQHQPQQPMQAPMMPPMGNGYSNAPVAPVGINMQAPTMNNQNMGPAAYPSNGLPPMPGMPQ